MQVMVQKLAANTLGLARRRAHVLFGVAAGLGCVGCRTSLAKLERIGDTEHMSSHSRSVETIADDIATTAALLDAGEYRLLTLIREFDERAGWAEQGALSCAQWLSWRVGMGMGAARERVRVALPGRLGHLRRSVRRCARGSCRIARYVR